MNVNETSTNILTTASIIVFDIFPSNSGIHKKSMIWTQSKSKENSPMGHIRRFRKCDLDRY